MINVNRRLYMYGTKVLIGFYPTLNNQWMLVPCSLYHMFCNWVHALLIYYVVCIFFSQLYIIGYLLVVEAKIRLGLRDCQRP